MYVYLLHFDQPYKHATHYLGYTSRDDLAARLTEHENGRGARLLEVIRDAGITWRLARVWQGDRVVERAHKRSGKARYCPICRPRMVALLGGPLTRAAQLAWSQQQLAYRYERWANPMCELCHSEPVAGRHRTVAYCAGCLDEFQRYAAMTPDERRAEHAAVNAHHGGDL